MITIDSIVCYYLLLDSYSLLTNRHAPMIHFHLDQTAASVAVSGGVFHVLWVEQLWSFHLRKVDHEIFEDGPSTKIGSLENSGYTVLVVCP